MNEAMKERKARAREWFAEHVVEEHSTLRSEGGLEIETLLWRRPGTWNYAVRYLRIGGTLIVTGDLYDGVYHWGGNPPKTLAWIGGCDIGYFASKCQASPIGRQFKSWDEEVARRRIEAQLEDADRWADGKDEDCPICEGTGRKPGTTEEEDVPCENPDCSCGFVFVPDPSRQRKVFEEYDGSEALDSAFEWTRWLDAHGVEAFGGDYYELSEVGQTIDGLCVAHLVGLKMAMEKLGLSRAAA